MSKIGRKLIPISTAKVEIKGNEIFIEGPKAKYTHIVPDSIKISLKDKSLLVSVNEKQSKKNNELWGLHRALIANKIKGVETGFEKKLKIVGLGFKAVLSGKKMTFSLGYSHKVDYQLPEGVEVLIDKTGQQLTLKSSDKFLLGNACSDIKAFKRPEPYKGTGIMFEDEVIVRKAGKAKAAAAS
ncbi:MAG: 50S ribosomal protein L6 [bacterium]